MINGETPMHKIKYVSNKQKLQLRASLRESLTKGPTIKLLRGGGVGDFEKRFPASACRKKKISCSTNVIESLWEKKGKKYPAHHIARKKNSWWPEITHSHPQELNGRPLSICLN